MTCELGMNVEHAARLLRDGQLVAFATETVYGLGANALDVNAIARVFAVKNRPHFDPLIVHVATRDWLPRLVTEWPEQAQRLADRFWPGPLTLVLPKTDLVPDLVTSGLPSVAVRMPSHWLALELLQRADVPVAAPSANPFGQLSPTRAEHVAEQLGQQIDYILDGGPCRVGVESTVVQIQSDRTVLLRPGGVPLEELVTVIGPIQLLAGVNRGRTADDDISTGAMSPGLLPQHYAPRTPLTIIERPDEVVTGQRTGLLTLQPSPFANRFAAVEILSSTGDLVEAATAFFAALRRLDARRLDRIYATPFPTQGLGRALNDRLSRAATT
jgi:L-threonylcarbamoyladenylate synthase